MTDKIVEYNGNKKELDHLISLAESFRLAHEQKQWEIAADLLLKIHAVSADYADAIYGELSYKDRVTIIRYA